MWYENITKKKPTEWENCIKKGKKGEENVILKKRENIN